MVDWMVCLQGCLIFICMGLVYLWIILVVGGRLSRNGSSGIVVIWKIITVIVHPADTATKQPIKSNSYA